MSNLNIHIDPERPWNPLASNPCDVILVSLALHELPTYHKAYVLSKVTDAGLMTGPWTLRLIYFLIRKRKASFKTFVILSKFNLKSFDYFWDNFQRHLLYGHDTEDHDSAGGFCQRELNMIWKWFNESYKIEMH